MDFKKFAVYDALDAELVFDVNCHGKTLKKGRILTSADIELLRQSGVKSILGVKFSADDVMAQTASDVLLKTIAGDNIAYTLPDENGYSELFANTDGVLLFDEERLKRFNAHSESMGLILIQPFMPVYKGQFLGNLKIFEPAVLAETLSQALTKVSGVGPLIKVANYDFCKVAFIQTAISQDEIIALDKDTVQKRFSIYGFNVISATVCYHSSDEVEHAVRNAYDLKPDIILVESPAPVINRFDVLPEAFSEASCDIDRVGLPIDKGLSVVLAHRKEVQLLGYSATEAQMPAFDKLLRFFATKSVPDNLALVSMASNGISFERMIQRITPEQDENAVKVGNLSQSEKIGVVILAAGSSRRLSGVGKLLETIDGLTLIDKAVRSALLSKAEYVVVVTGHNAKYIERRLEQYDVKVVRNADYVSGVLGSIRLGVSILPPDIVGAIIMPADMPSFTEQYLNSMIDKFDLKSKKRQVIMPSVNGVRYNPVLWSRDLFNDIKIIPEESHWVPALLEHSDYLTEVVLKDDLPVTDINTFGDLSDYKNRLGIVSQAEDDFFALEKGLK